MLSEDLINYLENNGIGTQGTDLFLGGLPDSQDNAVLVEDTGGVEPNRYVKVKQSTVQTTVRNTSYRSGYVKAGEIYDLLHQKYDETVLKLNGADVMMIQAISEPSYIGKDENGRFMFTINFLIWWRNV